MEQVARFNWWDPADIPRLLSVIGTAERILGMQTGGPVVRLAVKVGEMAKPYATSLQET